LDTYQTKDIVFSKIIQLMDAIGFKFYKKYNNCIKIIIKDVLLEYRFWNQCWIKKWKKFYEKLDRLSAFMWKVWAISFVKQRGKIWYF